MTTLTIEELAEVLQPRQAIAGLDLGTKTIGLSMSDLGLRFAGADARGSLTLFSLALCMKLVGST